MKQLFRIIIVLICCATANAQTSFNKTQTLALSQPNGDTPFSIKAAYIDGDAFLDLVIGTQIGQSIIWYKNDGLGNFTEQTTISDALPNVSDLELIDVNGDTSIDIMATTYTDDKLVWFANDPANLGSFGTEQVISTSLNGAGDIETADINGDTFLDVAVAAYEDNKVVWYAGDGSGNFGSENSITSAIDKPGSFDIKDADGDTDLDVVIATSVNISNTPGMNTSVVEIFLNSLAQNSMAQFSIDQFSVATGKDYMFNVAFEDIDNDGSSDQDVLATDLYGNLSWFKRDQTNMIYTETPFTTTIANPASIGFYDLDQNGDTFKDIILSSGTTNAGTDLVWYKGMGGSSYSAETIIDATQSQAYKFIVADLDNDNDLDIATIEYNLDQLNIFINERFTLDVQENNINNLKFFPNPVADKLFIQSRNSNPFSYHILDVSGRRLLQGITTSNTGIDVNQLNNGIYFLKVSNTNVSYKFVKK